MEMPLTRSAIVIGWVVFSVLLGCGLVASLFLKRGITFFLLLNGLNFVVIATAYIFRSTIAEALDSIRLLPAAIRQSIGPEDIRISYRYEATVGGALVVFALITGSYAVVLALQDPLAYYHLIREDGPVEYSSAAFWALAAVALAIFSLQQLRSGTSNRYQGIAMLLLIAFFVVAGGEEISWGQRVFALETPEFLKSVNVQNEITLHNIGSISVFSNAFFVLTVGFFILAPYLYRRYESLRLLADYYRLPVPNRVAIIVYVITLTTWLIVGVRFGTLGFHPFSFYEEDYYTQMDDEIFECMAAYSFLSFGIMTNFRRVRFPQG
jgi:hypothetical protein